MAVVVTVAKGYDLGYVWKNQAQAGAEKTTGGYYINAAQAGEPPGCWWGPGAAALGLAAGQAVERKPYNAVYRQIDPQTGAKLGRPRIAPAVSNAHSLGGQATADGREPNGARTAGRMSPEARVRVAQKALALLTQKYSTWTRHGLLKQLALVMPTETRRLTPDATQELLTGLADQALSGQIEDVVCLEAPQWPPLPAALRRELDGRSVYTRPGTARYAPPRNCRPRSAWPPRPRRGAHRTSPQGRQRNGLARMRPC